MTDRLVGAPTSAREEFPRYLVGGEEHDPT